MAAAPYRLRSHDARQSPVGLLFVRSPMRKLPNELLYQICGYLNSVDLMNLSLSCKQLHQIANDNRLWKDLLRRRFGVEELSIVDEDYKSAYYRHVFEDYKNFIESLPDGTSLFLDLIKNSSLFSYKDSEKYIKPYLAGLDLDQLTTVIAASARKGITVFEKFFIENIKLDLAKSPKKTIFLFSNAFIASILANQRDVMKFIIESDFFSPNLRSLQSASESFEKIAFDQNQDIRDLIELIVKNPKFDKILDAAKGASARDIILSGALVGFAKRGFVEGVKLLLNYGIYKIPEITGWNPTSLYYIIKKENLSSFIKSIEE